MSAHNHNSVHMKRMLAMQVKMETRFPGNFHTPDWIDPPPFIMDP